MSVGAQVFDFGELIKRKRSETGESQAALGVAIGVSRDAIIRWEGGGNAPGDEYLSRMEKHWGLEPDSLLAQKYLNILETAGIDPAVIVAHAPSAKVEVAKKIQNVRARWEEEGQRLIRSQNWEGLASYAMRKMRESAISRTVHVLEDSMPSEEIERRLNAAGIEYHRASEEIEPEPSPKKKRRG